ncbi:MAG TPA: orotate phosphoribosyltransferase [Methanomassiliicoccales archaeon]|nr:orotate phosphoribosyltransferase [Methanomassiliicoccales archaeon]
MSLDKDLKDALKECGAILYGDFTLASGKKSRYYIDIKKASTDPKVLTMIADLMAEEVGKMRQRPDRIAGVVLGSIPLAVALSLKSGIPFVMVRKEKKEHGTGKLIEGVLNRGEKVLVVEDVVTSAGSSVEAVNTLRSAGATVDTVLAVIDRQEGGDDKLSDIGVRLVSLLTAGDVKRG